MRTNVGKEEKKKTEDLDEFDAIFEKDKETPKVISTVLEESDLLRMKKLKLQDDMKNNILDVRAKFDNSQEYQDFERTYEDEDTWDAVLESLNSEEDEEVETPNEVEEVEEQEDTEDEEDIEEFAKVKKTNKVITGAIIAFSLVILGIGGFYLYDYVTKDTSVATSAEDLTEKVSDMYTSDKKSELKSWVSQEKVTEYLGNVETFKDLTPDAKVSLTNELNTVSSYLADTELVESLNAVDYDLDTATGSSSVTKLRLSLDTYTVPGLALTVSNNVSKFEDSLSYYTDLKNSLVGITDKSTFDYTSTVAKVNKITHKQNKEDLLSLCDKLEKAKTDEAEIDRLKKEATDEASKKARELQDSTNKQIEALKSEIEALKNKSTTEPVPEGQNTGEGTVIGNEK